MTRAKRSHIIICDEKIELAVGLASPTSNPGLQLL